MNFPRVRPRDFAGETPAATPGFPVLLSEKSASSAVKYFFELRDSDFEFLRGHNRAAAPVCPENSRGRHSTENDVMRYGLEIVPWKGRTKDNVTKLTCPPRVNVPLAPA